MPRSAILACVLSCLGPDLAFGLGEEDFGNAPLSDANYGDWPNVMPVINHRTRVYHSWVNGNEHFHYRGNTADANDALQKFAAITSPKKEVVLRPGPCTAKSFHGTEVAYDWELHLIGGIARHLSTRDLGGNVWPDHPVLTICIGPDVELEKLQIPAGIKVVGLADLKKRRIEAFQSSDQTVRGWGTGDLASLDAYDDESMKAIAKMLDDKESWVRLNAAGALVRFGRVAKPALPKLKEQLESDDAALKARAAESIAEIEEAEDAAEAGRQHRERLQAIAEYLKGREAK
jgi:hypothetical protein